MKEVHTIIIDIGNSGVKYYYSEKVFFDIKSLINDINYKKTPLSLHIISTVSSLIPEIIEASKKNFSAQELIIEKIEIFDVMEQNFLTDIYPGLGADRVAKLTGALKLNPNKNLILIDFGTATTMSIANSQKKFLGGFINLGFRTSLKALNSNCDALEDYSNKLSDLDLLCGSETKSTREAIIRGTYSAHLGLIHQWIKEGKDFLGGNPITICTGGDSPFFAKYFDQYITDARLLKTALLEDFTKV